MAQVFFQEPQVIQINFATAIDICIFAVNILKVGGSPVIYILWGKRIGTRTRSSGIMQALNDIHSIQIIHPAIAIGIAWPYTIAGTMICSAPHFTLVI